MARTTGYTCTAAANLVVDGKFSRKGICPPEYLGEEEENFKFIIEYLRRRGVNYGIKSL
jgi:lysine 6-dehydrogenase